MSDVDNDISDVEFEENSLVLSVGRLVRNGKDLPVAEVDVVETDWVGKTETDKEKLAAGTKSKRSLVAFQQRLPNSAADCCRRYPSSIMAQLPQVREMICDLILFVDPMEFETTVWTPQ